MKRLSTPTNNLNAAVFMNLSPCWVFLCLRRHGTVAIIIVFATYSVLSTPEYFTPVYVMQQKKKNTTSINPACLDTKRPPIITGILLPLLEIE